MGARENRGREGYRRQEKKGREAGSLRGRETGKKFKKASVRYLLLLIIQSKTQTQQRFLLPVNVLRGFKHNFMCEKT